MRASAGAGHDQSTHMLSLEDALQRMLEGVEPLPAEEVALGDALGRVLAAPISSRLTLPPWDNSAMDGFALRAHDVARASRHEPRTLRVTGESAAGHPVSVMVEPGTAVRILTGAPLPGGADAVAPVEDTDAFGPDAAPADAPTVQVYQPAVAGAHIRRAGSDVRAGDSLLAAGKVLSPARLAVCAAGGYATLPLHGRPRVAVLATGDELVAPGSQLGEAQIPDSNSVGLLAQATEAGAEAYSLGIAADRLDAVLESLLSALDRADVIVVSGGVSVGLHDVVKEAFAQIGRLELWRVAVQPGKPLAFARAARPAHDAPADRPAGGQVLLFGLPGNPVSSFVTFELFVRPVLRRLAGRREVSGREVVRARLSEKVSKSPDRRAFLRVALARHGEDGEWQASLAGGQGSHVLSALASADGLAIVPEQQESLEEGAQVDVIRLTEAGSR